MKHVVKVVPLYGEDGEVEEVKYVCKTHGFEALISPDFLKCVRDDDDPEIEYEEEW